MALDKPANLDASYEATVGDKFNVLIFWDKVDAAEGYQLYRDTSIIEVRPPYDTITVDGKERILYKDKNAWASSTPLDIFYWVSAVTLDPVTHVVSEQSALTGAVTNLHPKGVRFIEEARALIGDDLRVFNDKSDTVLEQVSVYNYKIAMDNALSDIASTPTPTPFLNYGNYPMEWKNLIVMGTLVFILPRLILFEQAKQMKYGDTGKEWTPPDLSGVLKDMLTSYREMYGERKTAIKHNVRPNPRAVGSLKALMISPQLLKWRHLPDSGRPFF